jgi:lambda family phage tail tape measure protein
MSDVIGRGVIEVSADSSKLNAAIAEARTRLAGLGDAGKNSAAKAAASIDKYVKGLETQNALLGKSARQIELYKLALKGATDGQLRAANAQLAISEAFHKSEARMAKLKDLTKTAFLGIAGVIGLAGGATISGILGLAKAAGDFQDLAEKTGESSAALASLYVSAKVGGVEMDAVGDAIVKLNKNLSGVDDESQSAGAAVAALGLNIADLKKMSGADQLETIGKALNGFAESAKKSEVVIALLGKTGAGMLPFLKELGNEGGRQNILTQKQIELADDYADRQAKSHAQISLHAQAIATKLIPALNDLNKAMESVAKSPAITEGLGTLAKGALYAAIVVFKGIAGAAADAALRAREFGRELAGIKDRALALKSGNFKKLFSIGDDIAAANAKDRAENRDFHAELQGIPKPDVFGKGKKTRTKADKEKDEADGPPKPTLKFTPPDPAAIAKAAAERKAQTELDVEIIKQGSEQILNTYQNADRILQARRSASLISETDYYEARAELIHLNADEQARALNAEVARMQQENLTGKERLQTERKIAEARGKLGKVREDEAIALDLNRGDEVESVRRITQAYQDAAEAVQHYIDTFRRQTARGAQGVGLGQKARDQIEGVGAIGDKLNDRSADLDSQLRRREITPEQYAAYLTLAKSTYKAEVDAFNERTRAIDTAQANGFAGMTEALHNYADTARDVAGATEHAFSNALSGIEDYFVQLSTNGKASFKDLVQSIQADFARAGFRSLIGKGIEALFGGAGGGGLFGGAGGAAGAISGAGAAAAQSAQTAALAASTSALAIETAASTGASIGLEALTAAAASASVALESVAASSAASAAGSGGGGLAGGLAALFEDGARAIGGPVSAGGIYRVNERGPELLSVAGKQYLMMGNQSGTVNPNKGGGGGQQPISVNINQTFAPGTDRTTVSQAAARSGMEARRALTRIT